MTPKEMATEFQKSLHCNCDLDNWEPERVPYTGHSWVCRIHRAVLSELERMRNAISNRKSS